MAAPEILKVYSLEQLKPHLHPPSPAKRFLEWLHVRQVKPADTTDKKHLTFLLQLYPDLMGDQTSLGPGDDGNCQSWKNNRYWWREIIR